MSNLHFLLRILGKGFPGCR